ncbi:unnamed protein product [Adineta steineri]|uniref:N-acetyltransferase domain-containing protein n=1 Tax=Adineta steineri TaxID=433720 RepID=A0A814NT29_9BILA|nr:unnamed protein product [Adineta steineri]CAF1154520.1 unnamed protein product [Adineta steineri]CAF3670419.1 unnamed protein product [Adineta steineri]CAF4139610.1 unnamed protein product [Adineta steineri]
MSAKQVLSSLTFHIHEPITQCLQITETLEFAKNIIKDCLQDQCSFIAFNTETNQIAGICLNTIKRKNQSQKKFKYEEKLQFCCQFFVDVHKNLNAFDELNANTLLHIEFISIDKRARGHRLASRLIEKSIEYAKELEIPGAFAEATHLVSLKCFKQQQFNILDELIYMNYDSKRLANLNDENNDRCYLVARKF